MIANNSPLPHHNKHTAYIEISKAGAKFLCVLVDGSKRYSVRTFSYRYQCQNFAKQNELDVIFAASAK